MLTQVHAYASIYSIILFCFWENTKDACGKCEALKGVQSSEAISLGFIPPPAMCPFVLSSFGP